MSALGTIAESRIIQASQSIGGRRNDKSSNRI